MSICMSLHRAVRPSAQFLKMIGWSLLVSACAGDGHKDAPQTGKVDRGLDASGRWSLQAVTPQNDCGIPQGNSRLLVDISQDGADVMISSTKGTPLWRGTISEENIIADTSATLNVEGRQFSFAFSSRLAFRDNMLVGEELLQVGGETGQPTCSAKAKLNAVRSINRARRVFSDSGASQYDAEPNDTVNNARVLPVNQNVTGRVAAASDRVDIYALPLEKSGSYQVHVGEFGNSDLDVALVDRLHNLLASSENAAGVDEGFEFGVDASQNGFLYLIVSGFATGEQSSDYSVRVTAP